MFRSKLVRQLIVLASLLFLLGACAETQLLVHTAKRLTTPKPPSVGKYKVGDPYQIKGIWYYPKVDYTYDKTGIASWYGPGFHGKKTANGEVYDQNALTAAHKTLPMPSLVQVTNLENGRSLQIKINDRGPFAYGRIIDLSRRGAQLLGFQRQGTARVRVKLLEAESRILVRQAKSGMYLASVDSPIQMETKLPKEGVAKEKLSPPVGATSAPIKKVPDRKKLVKSFGRPSKIDREMRVAPNGQVTNVAVKKGNMFIQVGAFTNYDNAYRSAARLSTLGNIKITSKIVNGAEYFRVRAGPIQDLSAADRQLEAILRAGFRAARLLID